MSNSGLNRIGGLRDPRGRPNERVSAFGLDPGVCFLNHGSFGSTPIAALEEQERWRRRVEAEPIRWFVEDLEPELDRARAFMAGFVGCDPEGFAFVHNATTAVSTVLNALRLEPGDEILTSAQEYNACNNAVRVTAERWGARVVEANLPWPVRDEEEIVSAVLAAVTPRTRLALVSHVTSTTALIMPVARLVRELADRGVETLVDGAHAPGYLPLNVSAISSAYYTGNFHKWLGAPKGSAFLFVREDRRAGIKPLVISHGTNTDRPRRSRFRLEFDYIGSLDYSAWLATPGCVRVMEQIGGAAWPALMERARGFALEARRRLMARFGTEPTCPESMVGAMACAVLPPRRPEEGKPRAGYHDPLWAALIERWGIQVPVLPFPAVPSRHVRVSAGVYNRLEQVDYLIDAIAAETGTGANLR
jgi:isopenicillin-N epimerase